jgi:preprotein translocase subunit SecF
MSKNTAQENKDKKIIDFLGKKKIAIAISLTLIIVGLISVFTKGLRLGIDFKGGTLLQLSFPLDKKVDEAKIRDILAKKEYGIKMTQVYVQKLYDEKGKANGQFLINMPEINDKLKDKLVADMKKNLGLKEVLRQENVGPTVGKELRTQAIKAIIFSLLMILAYVWYRFEFKFAFGAVVALMHDVLITLGLFSLFGKEFSIPVVAGFLTIIGYSLNDTIVISDRVRENMRLITRMDFEQLVNLSITQSLSRTINTSLTTFFPVLILWWAGGSVLENFALSLLIGVIVGTYSSMYIVAPIVIWWKNMEVSAHKK